jgi:drug/metabolite transporter (DMT)-like permease
VSGNRQAAAPPIRTVPAVPQHPTTADWGRLAAPGLIWGTSFFFIAEGLDSFPALLITPMRVAFGFVTLGMFRAARSAAITGPDLARIALLALVWMAFPLTMFPLAEDGRVSSSVTGMLNGATPLFVVGVASFLARRPPPRAQLVGLLVGLFGIVLISLPTLGEGSTSALGVAMILAALASYGVALNLALPLQQRYGGIAVLWRAQAFALVMTLPFGLPHVGEVDFTWHALAAVAALGVFGTALAYLLAANNAGRYGPTRTSITTYLIPVVALFLGALIRDETVHAIAIVGCGVALLGAFLAGRVRDSRV